MIAAPSELSSNHSFASSRLNTAVSQLRQLSGKDGSDHISIRQQQVVYSWKSVSQQPNKDIIDHSFVSSQVKTAVR